MLSILQLENSNSFKFLNAISVSKFILSSIVTSEKEILLTSDSISSVLRKFKSSKLNEL
jgi:hypothetical protein